MYSCNYGWVMLKGSVANKSLVWNVNCLWGLMEHLLWMLKEKKWEIWKQCVNREKGQERRGQSTKPLLTADSESLGACLPSSMMGAMIFPCRMKLPPLVWLSTSSYQALPRSIFFLPIKDLICQKSHIIEEQTILVTINLRKDLSFHQHCYLKEWQSLIFFLLSAGQLQ